MSRPQIRFTGFAILCLHKCISGHPGAPARDANGDNPLFFYQQVEHDKTGTVRWSDIKLDTFQRQVRDKQAKMSGQRWYVLRGDGQWRPISEQAYDQLLREWLDITSMPDEDYIRWKRS